MEANELEEKLVNVKQALMKIRESRSREAIQNALSAGADHSAFIAARNANIFMMVVIDVALEFLDMVEVER